MTYIVRQSAYCLCFTHLKLMCEVADHPNSPSKKVWRRETLPCVTEFQVNVNVEFFGVGKKKKE